MKYGLLFCGGLFLLLSFHCAHAGLTINEVELNPQGSDDQTQWVEFYSTANSENVSGLYLQNEKGDNFTLPNITITHFFVLDSLSLFDKNHETLKLFSGNILLDSTPSLTDMQNDNSTWSRMPDGLGSFVFRDQTKNLPNVPLGIENFSMSKNCVIENDSLIVSFQESGLCINSIKLEVQTSNINKNITVSTVLGKFSATLDSSFLPAGEMVSMRVHLKNCLNQTYQSSAYSFQVHHKTLLTKQPALSDGKNGWYITEPHLELINGDSSNLFYRWNLGNAIHYSRPFGLEQTPNNGNVTGGPISLTYWSDVCGNELVQNKTFKFDFSDPTFKEIQPQPDSVVYTFKPAIGVYLDEIYAGNSGINLSSVQFILDGREEKNFSIRRIEGIDAILSFVPSHNLGEGVHSVALLVQDNSGRESSLSWNFKIEKVNSLSFFITTPVQNSIHQNKLPLNITLSEKSNILGYTDTIAGKTTRIQLCKNCDSYGKFQNKFGTFVDGNHSLEFFAYNALGQVYFTSRTFLVDSRNPRILTTSPKSGFFNGTLQLEFIEENPKEIYLVYTQNSTFPTIPLLINLSSCKAIKGHTLCVLTLNSSTLRNGPFTYFFLVRDIKNSTSTSKPASPLLDMTPPELRWIDVELLDRSARLKLNITENNFKQVQFRELGKGQNRWQTLCSRLTQTSLCEKTLPFSKGLHTIEFSMVDKADNRVNSVLQLQI